MSITDELRKWAEDNTLKDRVLTTRPPQHAVHGVLETLLRIADRIDAEHESACAEAYGNGVESVALPDMTAYVKLPKDADGVPIRVGDVMEWPTTYETFEVVGIGDGTLFYIEDGSEQADWTGASTKRHHHAPTVEDVLREFADIVRKERVELATISEDTIAEYAAKLRLAGDAA